MVFSNKVNILIHQSQAYDMNSDSPMAAIRYNRLVCLRKATQQSKIQRRLDKGRGKRKKKKRKRQRKEIRKRNPGQRC